MRLTEQTFAAALRDTIAWSTPRIDVDNPRWSLRSSELRPLHDDWEDGNPGLFNCREYIQHVCTTRSQLVTDQRLDTYAIQHVGQLLLVDYNDTNHNEATEDESNGFFDWADNPPWDLWVCEIGDKLICWIPSEFISTVSDSIAVECMGMLEWVTDDHGRLGYPEWLPQYKHGG